MAAFAASDIRLKSNVEYMYDVNGNAWHSWTWNEDAEKLGLSGNGEGVIAQQVAITNPDAVVEDESGYLKVDYSKLGI